MDILHLYLLEQVEQPDYIPLMVCWSKDGAQVINHPQSNELNAMLYEKILELQAIELSYWKRNGEESILMLYFHGETTGMI